MKYTKTKPRKCLMSWGDWSFDDEERKEKLREFKRLNKVKNNEYRNKNIKILPKRKPLLKRRVIR